MLSGPALGHIGRLYEIAVAIRARSSIDIHFVIPAQGDYAARLLDGKFTYTLIPLEGVDRLFRARSFAEGLRGHLSKHKYSALVQDFNPMIWAPFIAYPDCPRAVVTNAFLTSVLSADTVQVQAFAEQGQAINDIRSSLQLPPLSSAFDLYEADKVLLADPEPIVNFLGERPAHYIATGHCAWDAGGQLPDVLIGKKELLLLSMGSTGPRQIDKHTLERIAHLASSRLTVYAGSDAQSMRLEQGLELAFDWLPLRDLIPNCAAVVSQGGAGSSYQALSMGCPLFVAGNHQNHRILADLLARMGLAINVGYPGSLTRVSRSDFTVMAERVLSFSQAIAQDNGAAKLADEICALC